jgi:anti-anti-sigma factor
MRTQNPRVTEYERSAVVRPPGSLEKDAAERIRAAMMYLLNKGDTELVLDMEAVPFINSEGLRMLRDVQQQAETREARLSLANANDSVLRTLNMTRMDRHLSIFASVEEALSGRQ